MAENSKIEWTDASWNPVVGCSVVSPGCTNCYAMSMAARLERMMPGSHYTGMTQPSKAGPVWAGKMALAPEHILTQPLKWRHPRKIFVNSMGDLFHESVPDEWIDRVFAVMASAPQHTFQILTKRAKRMRDYLRSMVSSGEYRLTIRRPGWAARSPRDKDTVLILGEGQAWPLPNVWLGVSVEDQARVHHRIPHLLNTPAAVRFISAEPLLGPIELDKIDYARWNLDALRGRCDAHTISFSGLDWVIVGGESGPQARPMHPDWVRSIRDQCKTAAVPFFFKQWGEWSTVYDRDHDDPDWRNCPKDNSNRERYVNLKGGHGFHGDRVVFMRKIGKTRAGRTLDGLFHDEFPEANNEH